MGYPSLEKPKMDPRATPTEQTTVPFWRDVRVLQIVAQIAFVVGLAIVAGLLYSNLVHALNKRGLSAGFGFLDLEAGFGIGESPIPYSSSDSYGWAFLVGVFNTLRVTLIGIALATALGVVTGVARLSNNWLLSRIAGIYIEAIRNTPLLVQLVFWYYAVIFKMPSIQEGLELPGPVFISQRGVALPWPQSTPTFHPWLLIILAGTIAAIVLKVVRQRYQERTGRPGYPWALAVTVWFTLALGGWFLLGQPLTLDRPVLGDFNYEGGMTLTTEFAALLAGLVVYTGAFIAEVVRGGILAVRKGQIEAAHALGLTNSQTLRLVIFPQALRVIIPPLTSQYLNLAKNSSLAVAIGYPDLFGIGKTIFNQTGRPVPMVIMIMGSYLIMSLTTSMFMNIYNRRIRFLER